MYKFAIVEDNEAAAEKLAGFLERYANENNEVFEIIKFHDALDFLDGYRTVYDAQNYLSEGSFQTDVNYSDYNSLSTSKQVFE